MIHGGNHGFRIIHKYVINFINVSLRMRIDRIERIGRSSDRGKYIDGCEEMCEGHFKGRNRVKHFMDIVLLMKENFHYVISSSMIVD